MFRLRHRGEQAELDSEQYAANDVRESWFDKAAAKCCALYNIYTSFEKVIGHMADTVTAQFFVMPL